MKLQRPLQNHGLEKVFCEKCLTCGKFGYPSWSSRAESVAFIVLYSSYNLSIFAMIITIIIVVVGGADQGHGGRVSSLELKTFGQWSVSRP